MITSCTLACGAFAQGDVGQDFRRATEDRRVAIDRGVAGAEPDIVRPELAAERQPFFIHQRLDRAGVDGTFALGQGLEMQRRRHERFARAGRRVQDDVLLLEQFQNGRLLRGIKLQLPPLGIFEKASEQNIVAESFVPGNQIIKCRCHSPPNIPPDCAREKRDQTECPRSKDQ